MPITQLFASKLLILVTPIDEASEPETGDAFFGDVVVTEVRLMPSQILKFALYFSPDAQLLHFSSVRSKIGVLPGH